MTVSQQRGMIAAHPLQCTRQLVQLDIIDDRNQSTILSINQTIDARYSPILS
jgi:hypothetical protein